ncbi:MAG: cell division protein FtsA [Candidatus Pacebacteria bacterium]|nr:cell division protein FtsA [Candidatus Paceibacterota bacterium]
MSRKNIAVGIDIGTYQVKVVIAEANPKGLPVVLGVGSAETKGLRHGYIIHIPDTAKSIRSAIDQAEKASGAKVTEAYLSVGGIGLGSILSHGSTTITKADLEITKLDIQRAIDSSETAIPQGSVLNRRIISVIPLSCKIDGKASLGYPEGARGTKLEVKTLFITCLERHFEDIIRAVEEAGVSVIDIVPAPIAASLVTLNKAQKTAGCVLANIGSETVSIVVCENNIPISLEVFPIGSNDITNDIALGLKIPLEEAEKVKLGDGEGTYPKKRREEIIVARLSHIF